MHDAPRYLEWAVAEGLSAGVACTWAARASASGEAHVERIIPDGCIDLVWTGGGLFVAGPDTASVTLAPSPRARFVGLRFRAGAAPPVLGVPAAALLDARVDARDVLGDRAARLVDALAAARSARAAAAIMAAHVARWTARQGAVDPLVTRAIEELGAPRAAPPRIASLASALGVSERQLRRRFVDGVGYGPKTLERVLRLRRFVALAAAPHGAASLAELAFAAGYADQPHLSRECKDLAGCTPAALVGYPVTAA